MGKPTKGQARTTAKRKVPDLAAKLPVAPMKPVPSEDGGVIITRQDDDEKCMNFEGAYEAQLTPSGDVAVLEMVADVANKNQGNPIPVIRRFVNHAVWAEVIVK